MRPEDVLPITNSLFGRFTDSFILVLDGGEWLKAHRSCYDGHTWVWVDDNGGEIDPEDVWKWYGFDPINLKITNYESY